MLFNSYIFIFAFLPLVMSLWWWRRMTLQLRLITLVSASYLFYGWWDYRFVSLLIVSTFIDYFAGHCLHVSRTRFGRSFWLIVSVACNLGILAFFKYSGFFASSVNTVADWLRLGGRIPIQDIILPVGISFYTFQTMSYSIDIFKRKAEPADSFLHFAAYVSLFPQLIAGPIVRYGEVESQLRNVDEKVSWQKFSTGITFFILGLAQKVLLADTIASKIDPAFADYTALQFFGSWFCILGYSCQLYFDFAGYSNMAVGLGHMMGFSFPQNFDSPYKSANISDFWRRWHMTLSSWLRDYLFIPLGGSRFGNARTMRNLVIVMFLGGLWHGAGWTFVLWGLYHGMLLVAHAILRDKLSFKLPVVASVVLTFAAVTFGWVLFRSTSMTMCIDLFGAMLGTHGFESNAISAVGGSKSLGLLSILLAIIFFLPNIWRLRIRLNLVNAVVLAGLFVVCVLRFDQESPFLYFQF